MKKQNAISVLAATSLLAGYAHVQNVAPAGKQVSPAEIRRTVREVDAGNIERTIRALVSFGTRSTLSAQNDPNPGIGGSALPARGLGTGETCFNRE